MEEAGIREAAWLARDCVVMTQAVALGRWISTAGPRPVTPRRVLRKPDLPAAAAVIGVPLPARLHRVIRILYGWDGGHLHAFRVRRTAYSDLLRLAQDKWK